jgi:DNA-binding transcriptional LysR family regulator
MTARRASTSTKPDTRRPPELEAIDLNALLRYLGVVETGSFARAARALGVSRQAVHRSVEALEATCGGPLLDRAARGVHPTVVGRRLLEQARSLREVAQRIRATVADASEVPSGVIRLAAPQLFAEKVLAGALAAFLARWPRVRVEARFDTARRDLVRDDFDLLVRVATAPPTSHHAALLGRADVCLCAAPEYLAANGRPATPEELAQHSLLDYAPTPVRRWALARDGATREVDVVPRLVGDCAAVVVQACRAGLGVLRAPRMAVEDLLAAGALVPVLDEWRHRHADVWAIYGHRSANDRTLEALLAALRASRWS